MHKYSIVLPVRNGGHHVKACVHSILSQTYAGFDLQVLDNYSTDGTREWILGLQDSRISVQEAERPLSIEENWQRIVTIQKNPFITLIGHDDLLHSDYLAVMDKLIADQPNASLYQTHFNLIDTKGDVIRKCQPMATHEEAPQFLQSILQYRFDLFGTGFMMRSADYDALGGLPPYPNLLFADFELWMKLTTKSYKATAPETAFSYRVHQSTTKSAPDATMHKAFSRFIDFLESLAAGDEALAKVIREDGPDFIEGYCKGLSHRLIRTPLRQRNGITVASFTADCKAYADRLAPSHRFDPAANRSIRLAQWIDSNPVSRQLFLWFKSVYSKPVMK